MSSAKPNELKDHPKPFLVLMAKTGQEESRETNKKGVSEKQLVELDTRKHDLWLRIDQQKLCPSEDHILRQSEKKYVKEEDKEFPLDVFGRRFDTEKLCEVELIVKQEDGKWENRSGIQKFKATGDDVLPLGSSILEAGNYVLLVIAKIHFNYFDHNGKLAISEEAEVNLKFWLDIKEKKDSSSQEDYDIPSQEAYLIEGETN